MFGALMLPHGPDREAFETASNANLGQDKLENTMSFMFETRFPQQLTQFAGKEAPLEDNYIACWADMKKSSTACQARNNRTTSTEQHAS
jgi:homogentisate 1,2-dioxygenase